MTSNVCFDAGLDELKKIVQATIIGANGIVGIEYNLVLFRIFDTIRCSLPPDIENNIKKYQINLMMLC